MFGCVVPFVLTVVLFAVGGQLIGPLAQRLREKSVWAEYVARVVDFAGIISEEEPEPTSAEPDKKTSGDSIHPRSARRPGVSDSSALPKDLPLHPAALEALYNVGPTHVLVFQRVAGPRDAAIANMRQTMGQHGWKVTSESSGDWSTIIRWAKGARTCMVEFADDSSGTEIWYRSVVPKKRAATSSR